MRRVCPQCQAAYETQFLCSNCGVQLIELSDRTATRAGRGEDPEAYSVSMVTRLVAGLLFAQCTYYGVRLLGMAFFRLIGQTDGWSSIGGLANPALMLVTVLAGGLLAGAGNARGLAAGAAVGLFHALALIGAEFLTGHTPERPVLYGGWIVIILVSAMAGRYGRFIWPPLSDLHDPTPVTKKTATRKRERRPREPIALLRVLGGAVLAIGCTVWAGRIREYIIGTSGGLFTADSRIQVQFVTWIISALAIIIGGAVAGASTRSGLKHGLLVGILACIGVFIIHSQVIREPLPAEQFFAAILGLDEDNANTPQRIGLFLATNALALGMFGGWFGASLLPRTTAGPTRLDRGSI